MSLHVTFDPLNLSLLNKIINLRNLADPKLLNGSYKVYYKHEKSWKRE